MLFACLLIVELLYMPIKIIEGAVKTPSLRLNGNYVLIAMYKHGFRRNQPPYVTTDSIQLDILHDWNTDCGYS